MAFNTIPIKRLDEYTNVFSSELSKDSNFLFWSWHTAFRILVPLPNIEPWAITVKVLNLKHWTSRGFPGIFIINRVLVILSSKFILWLI